MKKLFVVAAATFFGISSVAAKEIVSIKSMEVAEKSKAGKAFKRKQEGARSEFQQLLAKQQAEVAQLKQEVSEAMQNGAMTDDAMPRKMAKIEQKERRAEFTLQEKSAELQAQLKEEENSLRLSITKTAQEIAKREGWAVLVDANAPGVLAVADDTDRTALVLTEFDKKFDADKAKSSLAANKDSKPSTKTA